MPATCLRIPGTDLFRQLYVSPHRSCLSNFLIRPVTVYWHRANRSQRRPCNANRLTGHFLAPRNYLELFASFMGRKQPISSEDGVSEDIPVITLWVEYYLQWKRRTRIQRAPSDPPECTCFFAFVFVFVFCFLITRSRAVSEAKPHITQSRPRFVSVARGVFVYLWKISWLHMICLDLKSHEQALAECMETESNYIADSSTPSVSVCDKFVIRWERNRQT